MVSHDETIRKQLFEKLREISDDRDFVTGVMSFASHTEDRETILEFIRQGKLVTKKNLLLIALELSNMRDN